MNRLIVAHNVFTWAREQIASGEYATWAKAHPTEADALSYAALCADEMGLLPHGE